MHFVLDYLAYRRREGRYARFAGRSVMGGAFAGRLPPEAEGLLAPGDSIFTSQYGNVLAWAVMYVTSSEVSHVAIWLGDRKIAHATLGGLRVDPVDALYDADIRLLPVHVVQSEEERAVVVERAMSRVGEPYGWSSVGRKGLAILSGRLRPRFRWHFVGDVAFVLVVCDAVMWPLWHRPVLTWLMLPYAAIVLVNLARWEWNPLPADERYLTPRDLLAALLIGGARKVLDGDAVEVRRGVRMGD